MPKPHFIYDFSSVGSLCSLCADEAPSQSKTSPRVRPVDGVGPMVGPKVGPLGTDMQGARLRKSSGDLQLFDRVSSSSALPVDTAIMISGLLEQTPSRPTPSRSRAASKDFAMQPPLVVPTGDADSSVPRLDLGGLPEAARAEWTGRSSQADTDNKPSWTLNVMADPDGLPEVSGEEANRRAYGHSELATEGDEGAPAPAAAPAEEEVPSEKDKAADKAAGAKGAQGGTASKTKTTTGSHSPKPKESPHGSDSSLSSRVEAMNRYYQNKKLLTPRTAARSAAAKAAAKGDLAARRTAANDAKEARLQAAEARKDERRRGSAATKIQSWERVRRALRVSRYMRLRLWAIRTVQEGVRRWRVRVRMRIEAKERAEMEAKEAALRAAEQAAARKAAREAAKTEAARLKAEKEAAEMEAPGAARRRAKRVGQEEKELLLAKEQQEKRKAASQAKEAARQAQEEVERAEREARAKAGALQAQLNELKQQERLEQERLKREIAQQAAIAREEAFNAVRLFAEGMQELASLGDEHRDSIRTCGGIPPLVAMLGGGVHPGVELAAAMALTNVSYGSEANRNAIRKAGGIPPLVSLATASVKAGSMKYVPAMTNLASGTVRENQDALREAGGIPLLVGLLTAGPDSKTTCDAVDSLRHLTLDNKANCEAVRASGGVTWLVALLNAGAESVVATDAVATLCQMAEDMPLNQDAIRESGGIRHLIGFLAANSESDALKWAARALGHLAKENTVNRNVICEQAGTIARLVALLGAGASSESANLAADVLRVLMLGHDDRIAVSVLAAMKRQGIGLGQNASFSLADAFPGLLQGLTSVVAARLNAAVRRGNDDKTASGQIQMALNDAIALELPEEDLDAARAKLDEIAAARAEAIAARKARRAAKADKEKRDEGGESAGSPSPERPRQKGEASGTDGLEASGSQSTNQSKGPQPTSGGSGGNHGGGSSTVIGAQAVLDAAQTRLKEIESAAEAARRARREAAAERAGKGVVGPGARNALQRKKEATPVSALNNKGPESPSFKANDEYSDPNLSPEDQDHEHDPGAAF